VGRRHSFGACRRGPPGTGPLNRAILMEDRDA
jgi:hypothetical protein